MTTKIKGILSIALSVFLLWVGAYVAIEVIPPCRDTWWEIPFITTSILLITLNLGLFIYGLITVISPELIGEK